MQDTLQLVGPWIEPAPDHAEELAFAQRAAAYLDHEGLDRPAVVRCLIEELQLDADTAEAVAALAA
jgi:hypothetical protein